jgi:AraC-like DNA-binding protein
LGFVLRGRFAVRESTFTPGQLRFSPHVETMQLDLSSGFEGLVGELEGVTPLPPSEVGWSSDDAFARHSLQCIAADATHPGIVDIERWMLAERSRADARRSAAGWIDDLVLELRESPLDASAVRTWSDRTGRHRSTLHRSFRQSLGVDPSGWILRERLRRAWERLETEEPLVAIAADCGFADQSHMNRVFRRFTDWTPGALREARRRVADPPMRPGSKTAAGCGSIFTA